MRGNVRDGAARRSPDQRVAEAVEQQRHEGVPARDEYTPVEVEVGRDDRLEVIVARGAGHAIDRRAECGQVVVRAAHRSELDGTDLDNGREAQTNARLDIRRHVSDTFDVEGGSEVELLRESRWRQRPLTSTTYRVVNDSDLVPEVPPGVTDSWVYQHLGLAVTFTASYSSFAGDHSMADCYLYAINNPDAPMNG